MGLRDKVTGLIGGSGGESEEVDEIADEWADELDDEVESVDEDMDEGEAFEGETVQEEREWESAYRFSEEFLEKRGFSSMVDFANKCMAHRINQSPRFRDKISSGVETIDRLSHMQGQLDSIKGDEGGTSDYQKKAEELQAANQLIDQTQKLAGEEEAMVNDMITLGHEAVDAIANSGAIGGGGEDIQSNIQSVDEEM